MMETLFLLLILFLVFLCIFILITTLHNNDNIDKLKNDITDITTDIIKIKDDINSIQQTIKKHNEYYKNINNLITKYNDKFMHMFEKYGEVYNTNKKVDYNNNFEKIYNKLNNNNTNYEDKLSTTAEVVVNSITKFIKEHIEKQLLNSPINIKLNDSFIELHNQLVDNINKINKDVTNIKHVVNNFDLSKFKIDNKIDYLKTTIDNINNYTSNIYNNVCKNEKPNDFGYDNNDNIDKSNQANNSLENKNIKKSLSQKRKSNKKLKTATTFDNGDN